MKKLLSLLIMLIGLSLSQNVYANEIKKIAMDIYIDNKGTAHIKEEWTAKLTEGTEGYKPYYNLEGASISNFKVSMGNQDFTGVGTWNVNADFDAKAYKSGINYIADGLELCFGISKYGTNTYTMKYDIDGFVVSLDDADMVYWTLIPHELSSRLEEYYIKIYSDFKYEETLEVWGYGNYGGYAYVYDGYIELSDESGLDSSEYVVALIKFPKGTFTTNNVIAATFDEFYNKAEGGSTHYDYDYNRFDGFFSDYIIPILVIGSIVVPFAIVIYAMRHVNISGYGTKTLVFAKGLKKLPKDTPYFRDIPCDSNIYKAYWVAGQYGLMKQKTDFLGALLLKWLKEDRIQSLKVNSKFLKREEQALKFINNKGLTGSELEMYNIMFEASCDGVLESNEFKVWCKDNYSRALSWFDKAYDEATDTYIADGKINYEERKGWIFTNRSYIVADSIKEDATRMKGLKLFLKDFSMIHEREAIEVKLWEYYLMYAQIFGIAKKVAAEFKKLYPDIIQDEYYNNMIFIHTFSHTGVSAASSAKSRAESYSSGGGGFSSGGGGGGSFGGGGGGGGFR